MRRFTLRSLVFAIVPIAAASALARTFALYPLAMIPFLILGFFLCFYKAPGLLSEMQLRFFRSGYAVVLIPLIYLVLASLYVGLVWLIRLSLVP